MINMQFHRIIFFGLFMISVSGTPWTLRRSVSFVTRQAYISGTTDGYEKKSAASANDRMVFLDSDEDTSNASAEENDTVATRIGTSPRRTRPRRPPSTNYTEALVYRDENDKIYFPGERESSDPMSNIQKPDCAKDSTFCVEDKNYPKSHIESLLEKNYKQYAEFVTEDYITADLTQRNDIPGEESLCESYENKVYPTSGVNRDNKWLYIINQSNFTQGVRIEECRRKGQPCSLASLFPPTYVSECKQKFQYRQLLALDERGEIIKDFFRLPSCCKCYVRQG
ncbi:protein spaetzle isoform X3 [Lutzomyia longipalpis]|uniref:protein spaetzle isoform X3 n=1 Tax=Lutzomyia longipalpis TaxID=7200 RepID=UPI0024832F89|nr:protein spaetzle isoform X3 [Lutzomyia longipalpis]